MVFTRENRGGSRRWSSLVKIVEEEEAVFIRGENTNEDSPNSHQAQHRPVQATGAMSA